ncbi:MAG TPA: RNA polymerase sigma factor, partial [Gammaproteobacteria bacterium]|nr:RNA polymerase sigma factor [Gammaproteobacteria bacterium]
MQDRDLVEAVLKGDKAAQRRFYDGHVDRVYALSYRMTGNESSARECTQTAFIRMFDKLRGFRGESALSTWVHAVAVSVVLQWRRESARRARREIQFDTLEELPAASPDRGSLLDENIRRAIDSLPAPYQSVVVMYDIEGYTHEEIA